MCTDCAMYCVAIFRPTLAKTGCITVKRRYSAKVQQVNSSDLSDDLLVENLTQQFALQHVQEKV